MASSWKQWPVDQSRSPTPVVQFTVIVFSFILLLPENANIFLNVLPHEKRLRNLQKGIGFLSPRWRATQTSIYIQLMPDCARNGISLHQKYESELNVCMDINIWRSVI